MSIGNEETKLKVSYFFKTGKGQYGEGDMFLGIKVPDIRSTIKPYQSVIGIEDVAVLVKSDFHEIRLAGLLLWVNQFKKIKIDTVRKQLVDLYLNHTPYINNWDLVDLSCPYILGDYLKDKSKDILFELAHSNNMWEQRIAMVTTLTFIRNREYETAILLCEHFLKHKHDLMHKASGWCLREIGKKDVATLRLFLDKYADVMPRTMLRYSIEKLDSQERAFYMNAKNRVV